MINQCSGTLRGNTGRCLLADSKSELNMLLILPGGCGIQMKDCICTNHSTVSSSINHRPFIRTNYMPYIKTSYKFHIASITGFLLSC
jgi:hypothetical protein